MRRLLLAIAFLLGGSLAFAQSGGSSSAGGGLSTKAIQALEECFDDFDTFTCTGGGGGSVGGSGTTDRIPRWTAATTLGDSGLMDNGTNLSGSYGGTLGLTSTGDMTLATSDEMFLNAATSVTIPDDVELIFGTTATTDGPGHIVWNTFGGAGFERLEINGDGNAGILVEHGDGATGGFTVTDGGGSFVHTFTQNPPAGAGASLPTWIMSVTAPTSMDDAADQRIGLDLDMESGATDVAGSQQIGFFIDPIVARSSTQDQIVLGTTGWDNNIVYGTEAVRTALNFAAPSGTNIVTIPAATGTMAVFPLAANTIVTNSGVEMQFGGASTSIEGDGSILTLTGANGETIMVGASIDIDGNGEDMTMLSSGATVTMGGGDEAWEFSVDSFDVTAADGVGFDVTGGFVALATGTHTFFADTSALLGDPVFQIGDGNSGVSDIGISVTETIAAFDGSDAYSGLLIGLTNADHTGAGNVLNGLLIANITGDAQAQENPIHVGSGWDAVLSMEGATDDANEALLTVFDPGQDLTYSLPNLGSFSASAIVVSSNSANGIDQANSIWMQSNSIAFEGATANTSELTLNVGVDPTVDTAWLLNQMTVPASLAVFPSTLTTNAPEVASSVWGTSNGISFEGTTADAFETTLVAAQPTGVDKTITLPNTTGTVSLSTTSGVLMPTFTQATLPASANGNIVYCSNCNPNATCTTGGAGAFAFRIAGAWACELN